MLDCCYVEPTTVAEALTLLAEHGDGARVVAGGQVIALLLRQGFIKPSCLVSLQRVAGLDGITAEQEGVRIGAMVTLHRLGNACNEYPTLRALSEAAHTVADQHIRNRGTLGGNICGAHPASDINTALMTLNAEVTLVSTQGERMVNLHEFLAGPFTTTAKPGELLTEVTIPWFALRRSAAAYCRFSLRAGDFPVVSVGAFVSLDDTGQCQEPRIVLGNCLGAPTRATEAEQRLAHCNLLEDTQSLTEAAILAATHLTPRSEPMASSAYKQDLVGVLTRSALMEAVAAALEVQP